MARNAACGTGSVKIEMTLVFVHKAMIGDKSSSQPDLCQPDSPPFLARCCRGFALLWLAARGKLNQIVPTVVREISNGTSGLPRLRLAGFAIAVLLGGLVISWINIRVRGSMKDLEHEFGAIQTDQFFQAVKVRQQLLALNDRLMDYQMTGEQETLIHFRTDAETLKDLINTRIAEARSESERQLFRQLADSFAHYRQGTQTLYERSGFLNRVLSPGKTMDEKKILLERFSDPVLHTCDLLMESQSGAFESLLVGSRQTLDSLQQLVKLSLIMLLALALFVAVLVYRGMIAPLQVQLYESQAIIARQEKLAALGSLAAGVAHEIRNPLTAIKFRLFSLKKSLHPRLVDNEDADVIAAEISRLERIVRDFLEFARPSEPDTASVSAQQLLEEVARLMRPQLEESGVNLKVSDHNGVWLRVDFQQIKQVLINLIRNAAESIEGEGTVTLRAYTDAAPLAGKRLAVSVVEVADTGRGIPPEISRRLFDPFFTTKENGSGLGLSIAARIVEKHGGELVFESQPNRGTTFKLLLPTPVDHEDAHTAH